MVIFVTRNKRKENKKQKQNNKTKQNKNKKKQKKKKCPYLPYLKGLSVHKTGYSVA